MANKKLFSKKAVDVHAASNMFKDANSIEQKFKVVAEVLSDVKFRSTNDKKVIKEIISLFNDAKVEVKNNDLVFNITGEKAEEMSKLLSMENDKGELEPIVPADEFSSPEKVVYAVKTFVEYSGARNALAIAIASREQSRADGLVDQNEAIKKENLEYIQQLTEATAKINDLQNEIGYHEREDLKNKKYKKASRIALLLASVILTGSLTANIVLGAENCGIKKDNAALAESLNRITIERDAALKELDEIVAIIESNGISVTDIDGISDAVKLLIASIDEDAQADINQMYATFLKPLEAVGLKLEDVMDENGNIVLDKVPEAIQGVVNGVVSDLAELSSVRSTVADLFVNAQIPKQDGTIYTINDFKSLGGEDGAINYIVGHYKTLYANAYKQLVKSLGVIEDLEKELDELEAVYGDLYSTVVELQDRYNDLSDDYNTLLVLYNSTSEENATLKEENAGLKEENANLKEENADLKEENEGLKNQGSVVGGSGSSENSSSTNKQPVSDEEVTDESTSGKDQQNSSNESDEPSMGLGD